MTQITTMKLAAVSTMVGVLLLFGAFLLTTSLAGAQTPPPEPTPQTQPAEPRQTPPGDGSGGQRDGKECDRENEGAGDASTGVRFRGGPGSFRQ